MSYQPDKPPNRKERRLALFGPPKEPEAQQNVSIVPGNYWWPTDTPFIKRPAAKVLSGIPALAVVAWLIPNFLQMRGVVNVTASRVVLYLACLILIGYLWILLLALPKPRRILAVICSIVIAAIAIAADVATLPKPKPTASLSAEVTTTNPVTVKIPDAPPKPATQPTRPPTSKPKKAHKKKAIAKTDPCPNGRSTFRNVTNEAPASSNPNVHFYGVYVKGEHPCDDFDGIHNKNMTEGVHLEPSDQPKEEKKP